MKAEDHHPKPWRPALDAGTLPDGAYESACDRLLAWPAWLAGLRAPGAKRRRTLEMVHGYAAAGHHPASIELWVRIARHPNAGLSNPAAWVHSMLHGYGAGWTPTTRAGAEEQLHSAVLACDWERAERELNRRHFRLAETAAVAEATAAASDLAALAADPMVADILERMQIRVTSADHSPELPLDRASEARA